jgi:xylulokinase
MPLGVFMESVPYTRVARRAAYAVVGIDVGTGGTRALVVGDDGRVLGAGTCDHAAFASPQPGWAEQSPDDWWRATQAALATALTASRVDPRPSARSVFPGKCMAQCCSMRTCAWSDRPSSGAISGRTPNAVAEFHIGAESLLAHTCNPALTNFTLTKLLWVRTHEPEAWRRVRHVLLPKDYVRLRLSGSLAMDVTDASGTLMFDVARRRWSREILDGAQIDPTLLPQAFESADVCGSVSEKGASASGLVQGTPIVAGAGDQAAGATESASCGRCRERHDWHVRRRVCGDRSASDGSQGRLHTFCHAAPHRWHLMGVTQAAGLSLRWLRDQLGARDGGYDSMIAEAARVPRAPMACSGRRTSWANERRTWIPMPVPRWLGSSRAIIAAISFARCSRASPSACGIR